MLLKRFRTFVLLLGLASQTSALRAVEQDPPAEAPSDFVSGTVVDFQAGRLVVNRAVAGQPAENHTFSLTPETKIEGRLKVQARVTVGFKTTESGETVAVRVIVRPQSERKQ
jgi:hypothetical protein